jgi:drug/metabolite transporter (DMT)-like permease
MAASWSVKPTRVLILTSVAMVAFAANSLLCRLALRRLTIDAASFSTIRIVSGAIALWLILKISGPTTRDNGSWISAAALFAYVATLSFAGVQSTMIIWGVRKGECLDLRQWIGFSLAASGLILLVLPGLSTPPLGGSALMIIAGIAWGIYSLRGKAALDPVGATTGNFVRAVPMTALLSLAFLPWARVDAVGLTFAIISGAITSGLGYVIWYAALTGLTATTAATVQLSVPVLAAIGGILFLNESLTPRFVIASIAILGGIALVVITRRTTILDPRY